MLLVGLHTILDLFAESYTWKTYSDVRTQAFAAARALSVVLPQGSTVGLLGANRDKWYNAHVKFCSIKPV